MRSFYGYMQDPDGRTGLFWCDSTEDRDQAIKNFQTKGWFLISFGQDVPE